MRVVNGYFCRNCADVELAKKGRDPADPQREHASGTVYIPPPTDKELGVNRPEESGAVGTRLNLRA
jgi:hypothetical protein